MLPSRPPEARFCLPSSPIEVVDAGSSRHADPGPKGRTITNLASTVHDQVHRTPWPSDGQILQFRAGMAASRLGLERMRRQ